jgi:hypothetical protein
MTTTCLGIEVGLDGGLEGRRNLKIGQLNPVDAGEEGVLLDVSLARSTSESVLDVAGEELHHQTKSIINDPTASRTDLELAETVRGTRISWPMMAPNSWSSSSQLTEDCCVNTDRSNTNAPCPLASRR